MTDRHGSPRPGIAGRKFGHDYDDDPFANFQYAPPKATAGKLRGFSRRSKYQAIASLSASRERLGGLAGSQSSLSSFGSTQSILDSAKMMDMAEDARSRRISAEIMKHRLYESVITSPRRRRLSVRADYYGNPSDESEVHNFYGHARYVQSLPVTPAHSQNVTPSHSPTSQRKFLFGFFSRGTTPDEERKAGIGTEVTEDSWTGLTSIFKPSPRIIPAHEQVEDAGSDVEMEDIENRLMDCTPSTSDGTDFGKNSSGLMPPPRRRPPRPPRPCVSPQDMNAMTPTSF